MWGWGGGGGGNRQHTCGAGVVVVVVTDNTRVGLGGGDRSGQAQGQTGKMNHNRGPTTSCCQDIVLGKKNIASRKSVAPENYHTLLSPPHEAPHITTSVPTPLPKPHTPKELPPSPLPPPQKKKRRRRKLSFCERDYSVSRAPINRFHTNVFLLSGEKKGLT